MTHLTKLLRSSSSQASPARRLTQLILLADTPPPPLKARYGLYHDVFASLFQRSIDTLPDCDFELEIKSYDVVNEPWQYPSEEDVKGAAGLLITGSAASAYEDIPWINKLVEYTAGTKTLNPKLKLIGICYGHQIIARAYGATVEKNAKGWELGVRTVNLTDLGKRVLLGKNAADRDTVTIHQVHQDHVPDLPEGFGLLGSTPVCKVQGMVHPAQPASLKDIEIFALQGHPEFSPDFVTEIINIREAKGILTKEFAEQSRKDAALHDEGVALGAVILNILDTAKQ